MVERKLTFSRTFYWRLTGSLKKDYLLYAIKRPILPESGDALTEMFPSVRIFLLLCQPKIEMATDRAGWCQREAQCIHQNAG